jgi:hypothetical protein
MSKLLVLGESESAKNRFPWKKRQCGYQGVVFSRQPSEQVEALPATSWALHENTRALKLSCRFSAGRHIEHLVTWSV